MSGEHEITAPLVLEELKAGWALKGEERPRLFAVVQLGAKTDLGRVRENNEDKFDTLEPDEPAVLARKGRFYAIADGMGGHAAGQIAAELALTHTIRAYYGDTGTDIEAALYRAVKAANEHLVNVARAISGRSGMGTTLTAAVLREGSLYIAQVGDSRAYLIRNGEIQQLTEDHSWVAEQVRLGAMSPEEAEHSPYRNVITRSLGAEPEVEPDIQAVEVRPGDRFLLCSDGLSGMVPDEELGQIAGTGSPSVAAWNLIDRANRSGGKDNITALLLAVTAIVPFEELRLAADRTDRSDPSELNRASEHRKEHQPPMADARSVEPASSKPEPRRGFMKGLLGRLDRET